MRTLWLVRSDLEKHPGGDTTQILQTAAALRKRGVSVEFSSDPKPDLTGFDLVHLFHLDRLWENVRWSHAIRDSGIPSVISPIFWTSNEFDRSGRFGLQGLISRTVGPRSYQNLRILQHAAIPAFANRDFTCLSRRMFDFFRSARLVLNTVHAMLPGSRAEQMQIERYFGVRVRSFIVPNAVDSHVFSPAPRGRDTRLQRRILCVGRIEPRKNQLALIRALRERDVELLLVGAAGRFSQSYMRSCRREASGSVHFLEWRRPAELLPLYRSATVHVSVSWYETPGLANLEAARCACPVVVTAGGSTREYFRDQATYCSPDNPASIREAVRNAAAGPRNFDLAERIAAEFTWDVAAERTLNAYGSTLEPERSKSPTRGRTPAAVWSTRSSAAT